MFFFFSGNEITTVGADIFYETFKVNTTLKNLNLKCRRRPSLFRNLFSIREWTVNNLFAAAQTRARGFGGRVMGSKLRLAESWGRRGLLEW